VGERINDPVFLGLDSSFELGHVKVACGREGDLQNGLPNLVEVLINHVGVMAQADVQSRSLLHVEVDVDVLPGGGAVPVVLLESFLQPFPGVFKLLVNPYIRGSI